MSFSGRDSRWERSDHTALSPPPRAPCGALAPLSWSRVARTPRLALRGKGLLFGFHHALL